MCFTEHINQSINIRLLSGTTPDTIILINFYKHSCSLGRDTCLAPEGFKRSICGPRPKKAVHHCSSSLFDSASPVDDDASSTARRCSNGDPLLLIYRKLITTCIFVLLSVFSSMIVPRVHTESRLSSCLASEAIISLASLKQHL